MSTLDQQGVYRHRIIARDEQLSFACRASMPITRCVLHATITATIGRCGFPTRSRSMRPRSSSQAGSNTPHESAGTGVARAWWKSLHPLAWALLVVAVGLAAWLWH
ncbi:hypothetical protein [Stenotrophomonas panacihumi]|uniref:hypothetical protein n=1 Tax=Stenotrophomonas panacihumi TaxID=676599 RepID=UPI0011B27F72|nr:hypothetical protein [Stenotrophomonas panacihumi]